MAGQGVLPYACVSLSSLASCVLCQTAWTECVDQGPGLRPEGAGTGEDKGRARPGLLNTVHTEPGDFSSLGLSFLHVNEGLGVTPRLCPLRETSENICKAS